ncbi:uncharacterized protein LOC144678317, partial [Cetorhinus maximus]
MAVMNYQYIKEMNGFRVYILEGHPSLKSGERHQPQANHRTGPPPSCPIKRKHPVDPIGLGQSVEEGLPTAGRALTLLMVDRPAAREGPTSPQHQQQQQQQQQASGPPADQPLALVKKRPGYSSPTSGPSGTLPPSMLQQ